MLWTGNIRRRAGQRQRAIQRQDLSVGPMTLKFITILVLALLTLVYLIQSSKGSTQQIQMTSLEEKKEELENEKREVELEAIRLRSLERLKDTKNNFNLEPVTNSENLGNTGNGN